MEIVIKGNPKEIAALVLAVQEQQKEIIISSDTVNDARMKHPVHHPATREGIACELCFRLE